MISFVMIIVSNAINDDYYIISCLVKFPTTNNAFSFLSAICPQLDRSGMWTNHMLGCPIEWCRYPQW